MFREESYVEAACRPSSGYLLRAPTANANQERDESHMEIMPKRGEYPLIHSYLDPRTVTRETSWFLVGAALTVASSALFASTAASLIAAILPTLAILSAASRSFLPALLCLVASAVMAISGVSLAPTVAGLGLALGLIFAAQRFVENL